jgi:hypothetical protein
MKKRRKYRPTDLLGNKIASLMMLLLGLVTLGITQEATAAILFFMAAVGMFFAKHDLFS